MTALAERLIARIEATGPMTVADFMAECLLHPLHGYYATRDPFGQQGDFVTAPEISQMFGELVGLCLAQTWVDQGSPREFVLAELGPGRGTLMADMLRAAKAVPGFASAARVALVEASPKLREVQRRTLYDHEVTWVDRAGDLPEGPLFLVANEFFDALPIRQFVRDGDGWRERQVGLAEGTLSFGLSAAAPLAELSQRLADTRDGDIVETCAPARPVMATIAGRLRTRGGAALIVDYGAWRSLGDTLQAVRAHRPEHPLAHPGEADLTAHVDFEALADAAAGLKVSALTSQGVFLERLGITARARALARDLRGETLEQLVAAHRRLTHPAEMGSLFRVIGLVPQSVPLPPGLEP